MHKIEICDLCKKNNLKSLIPKIKDICPIADIKIGCIHFCGIGKNKIVILFDHIPIIGDTEDEVIKKLAEKMS